MSARHLLWAYEQNIKPGTRKNIFVYLVYRANDERGESWPSISLICKATGYDRDTVIDSLADLLRRRLTDDTGQRKGATCSVIVYRIVNLPVSSRKNGTAKQSGFPPKQSEFSPKQSRFSPENKQNKQKYAAAASALAEPPPPLLSAEDLAVERKFLADFERSKGRKLGARIKLRAVSHATIPKPLGPS